jgi:hypothetical protein
MNRLVFWNQSSQKILIVIPGNPAKAGGDQESRNFVGAYGIRPRLDAGFHRHDGIMVNGSFKQL